MAKAFFCVVENISAAEDLSRELAALGVQAENLSLAWLESQQETAKNPARIEAYEPPRKKLTSTGHFKWALQASERPLTAILTGMGMPKHEARRYEGLVRSGAVLLSVFCAETLLAKRVKTVLQKMGAREIASASDTPAEVLVSASTK